MEQSDLNAAQLFVHVVQQGSFTAAARTLGLPKSTLSRKIAELEQRLGARLLQRTTRKLSLTDLGAAYHERAQRAVRELIEAESLVSDSQTTPRGILRVTAPPDLGSAFLAWTMPEFSRAYPDVSVVLDLSGRTVDLIAEGFDVALRAGSLRDSSLIAKPVFSGTLALYASPEYLDAHGRPERPEQLVDHDCVAYGTSSETHWELTSAAGKIRIPIRPRVVIQDYGYLRLTVVAGAGIALLPDFLVGPEVHRGRLEQVLPDYSHSIDNIYVVYPTRTFLPAKTRAFIDFVESHFADWHSTCLGTKQQKCLE